LKSAIKKQQKFYQIIS